MNSDELQRQVEESMKNHATHTIKYGYPHVECIWCHRRGTDLYEHPCTLFTRHKHP